MISVGLKIVGSVFFAVSKSLLETLPKVGNLLALFFYLKDYPCFSLTPNEQRTVQEYHTFIRKRLRSKGDLYRREVVLGLMQGFFFELCNIFNNHAPAVTASVKSKSRKEYIFERFYETLVESYQSERSVKFYADQLCLTPKHLSGVVKEVSGKTVGEWIDEFVILEAMMVIGWQAACASFWIILIFGEIFSLSSPQHFSLSLMI